MQAGRALDVAVRQKGRGHQAWALRLLGDIASLRAPADPDQALTHYRQALALADELGMRPLAAHCHLGLGKLYGQIGNEQEAQVGLVVATRLYREMNMQFWLDKADARR